MGWHVLDCINCYISRLEGGEVASSPCIFVVNAGSVGSYDNSSRRPIRRSEGSTTYFQNGDTGPRPVHSSHAIHYPILAATATDNHVPFYSSDAIFCLPRHLN